MDSWKKAKIGDFVTAYEKGIHKVVDITDGCGCGKCFHLERVLNSTFKLGKGKSVCDGAYVQPFSKEEAINRLQEDTKKAIQNIERYL